METSSSASVDGSQGTLCKRNVYNLLMTTMFVLEWCSKYLLSPSCSAHVSSGIQRVMSQVCLSTTGIWRLRNTGGVVLIACT